MGFRAADPWASPYARFRIAAPVKVLPIPDGTVAPHVLVEARMQQLEAVSPRVALSGSRH